MRHQNRDRVLLEEMLDLIDLTIRNLPSTKTTFLKKDLNARDATALRLQAIGEHMRSLSAELREKHPELPWRQVIAMRNVIAHEYGNLDFDIVWNVVKGPEFKAFREHIKKILDD